MSLPITPVTPHQALQMASHMVLFAQNTSAVDVRPNVRYASVRKELNYGQDRTN